MVADPLLLKAGSWLAIAGGVLLVLTVLAFVMGWGLRFRLVGVSSFTLLLAAGCCRLQAAGCLRKAVEQADRLPLQAAPARVFWGHIGTGQQEQQEKSRLNHDRKNHKKIRENIRNKS